jgi:hypothetical protein
MMCFIDKLLDSITSNLSPKCELLCIVNLLHFKNRLETSVSINIRLDLKGG